MREKSGYTIAYNLDSGLLEVIKFNNDAKIKIYELTEDDFINILKMLYISKSHEDFSDKEYEYFLKGLFKMINNPKGEL